MMHFDLIRFNIVVNFFGIDEFLLYIFLFVWKNFIHIYKKMPKDKAGKN